MNSQQFSERTQVEEPARALLERLGYADVPRAVLAAERDSEREVLPRGRQGYKTLPDTSMAARRSRV